MKLTTRFSRVPFVVLTLAAVGALSACGAWKLTEPVIGYSCCNLREYEGWISSNNLQGGLTLAAGQKAEITKIKNRFYLYGYVGDHYVQLRDDAAKNEPEAIAWTRTVIVKNDPKPMIESWPAEVRAAVSTSRIRIGMTKQQVMVSLAQPSRNDTPDLNAPVWRYWSAVIDEPADVHFDADGRVERVTGNPKIVQALLLP